MPLPNPVIVPLALILIEPPELFNAKIPWPELEVIAAPLIDMFPTPLLLAETASPALPRTVPIAEIVIVPPSAFLVKIPLADPVTAFAVIVIAVAIEFLFAI